MMKNNAFIETTDEEILKENYTDEQLALMSFLEKSQLAHVLRRAMWLRGANDWN